MQRYVIFVTYTIYNKNNGFIEKLPVMEKRIKKD